MRPFFKKMLRIPELDHRILLHLDFFTLWQVRQVSSYLKSHCTSASFWKNKLRQDYQLESNEPFQDYCIQMGVQALNECRLSQLYLIRHFLDYYRFRINVNGCGKILKKILPNKIVVASPKLLWAETTLNPVGNKWYTRTYNTPVKLKSSVH